MALTKNKILVEYNLVLENSRLKEDMGIESLHFSKSTFNILDVMYFRESFTDDGELEPYTLLMLEPGIILTIDIPYEEFKTVYKKIINE